MRSTRIALVVVVLLAVGLCTFSYISIHQVTDAVDALRIEVQTLVQEGDNTGAMEKLVEIANRWEESMPILEILTSHDVLHEAIKELVDAQVCLENGDIDDCLRSLAQLGEVFNHVRDMEEISLTNLY